MNSDPECPLASWRRSPQPGLRRIACTVPVKDHVVIRDGEAWRSYGIPNDPFAHWISRVEPTSLQQGVNRRVDHLLRFLPHLPLE